MDKREAILSQIELGVLPDILPAFQTVARNRGLHDNDARPVAVLMDGDEASRLTGDRRGRAGVIGPELITMQPKIYVILKNKKPANEQVGQDLNAFRIAIIEALGQNIMLQDLIGSNGNLTYDGCETDLKSGAAAEGQMRLDFSITYVLNV